MATQWYTFKCSKCSGIQPSMVIIHWGFDHNGVLYLEGICRHCYYKAVINHTQDEQAGDIREMFLVHLDEQSDQMSIDMLIWENELLEDEDEGE